MTGVINSYRSGFTTPQAIPDPPVPGVLEWISENANAFKFVICSARAAHHGGAKAIEQWLDRHGFRHLVSKGVLTVSKDGVKPPAILYIDDRGYRFEGTFPSREFMQNFQPYKS